MSSAPDDTPAPVASRLWWAVPAVALIILGLFGLIFGGGPEKVAFGSSYDASNNGYRAAYLVLDELKYPVERSRRPSGGEIRWALFPFTTSPGMDDEFMPVSRGRSDLSEKDARPLDDWVQRGGLLLLATDSPAPLARFGLTPGGGSQATGGPEAADAKNLAGTSREVVGPAGGRGWGSFAGKPLVTIYPRGKGQIWFVNRPDVFENQYIRDTDNAVLICRIADAMRAERPGGRIAFDEHVHGLRDRPGAVELLFRPPVLGVTIQVLVLAVFALWHFGPRFGPLRTLPPPNRRSKEEFLDALAALLARKGDRAEAYRTIRDDLARRIEQELGLPAGTSPELLAREAERRRGVRFGPLRNMLEADSPPGGNTAAAFLSAIHELEAIANECLRTRPRR
jgi:hypothetical protein